MAGISLGDSKCWDIWTRGWGMRVWDRLGQKEDGLCCQADLGLCHLSFSHPWVSFPEPNFFIYETGCLHGSVTESLKHLQCASPHTGH